MSALATVAERPLSFELRVRADGERFGLELAEVGGSNGRPAMRAMLDPEQTARVIGSVLAALRESKLGRASLGPHRMRPLRLSEPAGVRLALVMVATAPLVRRGRALAIEEGIGAMSNEEVYYWYAKCNGPDASRARRALRLLLADD